MNTEGYVFVWDVPLRNKSSECEKIEEKIESLLKESNRLHKKAFTITKKIIKK